MRSVNPGRTRGSKVGAPGEGTAQLSESAKDSGGRRRHKEGPTRLRLTYTGVVAIVFWLAFLLCALNTGTKTRIGVINTPPQVPRGDCAAAQGNALPRIAQEAKARDKAVGIVSTARLTHATPAAVYAKTVHRACCR